MNAGEKGRRPESRLSAVLHHLALGSQAPERLAEFYASALGYDFTAAGDVLIGQAADRHMLLAAGQSKALVGAGYALPDPGELDRLRRRIDAAGWPQQDGATPFFTDAVTVCDPDGTRFTFGIGADEPSPTNEAQARPARLQHVVMASRNPDRMVRFFTDVIGFTLSDNVLDDEGEVRTSFMRSSHEHHSLAVFLAAEDRLDHHCYETMDWNLIRDWCDHLAGKRIPIAWGPGRHGPGNNLFIFVHDPDGNWVEISAELEVVEHDRPVGSWPHEERTLNSWGQGLLRS